VRALLGRRTGRVAPVRDGGDQHANDHNVPLPSPGRGRLAASTINRHLVSIKRYFGWAVDVGLVTRDTSRVVKLIPRTPQPPRHLTDREEEALMAAVSQHGNLRDRTLLIVALHTGLRAEELCRLKSEHVHLGRRSGHVSIYSK
jgi:integrase/recombinase XerD